jgi:prephenate dehydrogenase
VKIAIIGGYGKMGMWFARHLKKEGCQVIIAGRDQSRLAQAAEQLGVEAVSSHDAVNQADTVILSLPIDGFEAVVEDIAPFTHEGQLIFDVTSVKGMPVRAMHDFIKNGTVLGTHPMFGPGADGLANQRFVLTPTNNKEEELAGKVKKYLEERQARVVLMSPQEHDEIISIVLGLSHFIALVAADTLLQTGKLEKASAVSGTTFKLLLTLAESVLSEDPAFYASLQMGLPDNVKLQGIMSETLQQWRDIIGSNDRAEFTSKMSALKQAFLSADPHFKQAYNNMYKLIG